MNGTVYAGDAVGLARWCATVISGPNPCHYQWRGMDWYVTVETVNGHEIVRHGDAIIQVAPDRLKIVRKGE